MQSQNKDSRIIYANMRPIPSHLKNSIQPDSELSPFAKMNPFKPKPGGAALVGGGQVGVLGNVYPSNRIRTSKYTSLNFIPKNLFEQFRRVANIFFLVINVLQFFPPFQTINPWVASTPLIIIIFLTMVKDGFEDYKRHDSDNTTNNRPILCLEGLHWTNENYKQGKDNLPEPRPEEWWEWIQWMFDRLIIRPIALLIKYLSTAIGWIADALLKLVGYIYQLTSYLLITLKITHPPQDTPVTLASKFIPPSPSNPEDAKWTERKWADVKVGDFVMVRCDEEVPADLIVLGSSSFQDSGGSVDNICYVETKSLDGETNLKLKEGAIPMNEQGIYPVQSSLDCTQVTFWIESEPPSANMHGYQGMLCHQAQKLDSRLPEPVEVNSDVKVLKFLPLSESNLLLRGTVLRDTTWVIGIVVFTGNDTKVMMNAGPQPSKRSWIEREMNYAVIVNLSLLGLVCLITAVYNPIWTANALDSGAPYVDVQVDTGFQSGLIAFLNAMIQYQNFLPISLYLTVEIVKSLQAFFIRQDREMYYAPKDKPCIPRSWNLSDDLGQIEYVFSDKTGTLTRNVMEFKACCINGVVYHDTRTPDQVLEPVDRFGLDSKYADTQPVFYVPELQKQLGQGVHGNFCMSFFKFLAVCHSVLIAKPREGQEVVEGYLEYRAQSPDEAALVKAAKDVGITFVSRETDTITIDVFGKLETYQVLNVLEFSSDRKRMSVVVKRPGEEDTVTLLCKGADSVILSRIKSDQGEVEKTNQALDYFAREGLRTLCLAYRIIPNKEYEEWSREAHEASIAMTDRESKVEQVQELLERDMSLLGCTAIEDKLQDGVPECIRTLLMAGIKVWVLTGDKMETAINIGISCNLLDGSMDLIVVRGKEGEPEKVGQQLASAFDQVVLNKPRKVLASELDLTEIPGGKDTVKTRFALVIDGLALKSALEEPLKSQFLEVGRRCASVICCRVSPLQKAQVLKMVKLKNRALCLAIGDGANDVSMIQAADIGVGIEGEEGLQAVASSDYSFAQFRFLSRLLLVHGRWNYHRTAEMLLNFFYKNFMTTMPLFLYQFYCGFSNSFIFDPNYVLFSQTLFTALPVMALGAFDRDLEPKYAISFPPAYYERGIRQELFTKKRFWQYTIDGLYQSIITFYVVVLAYETGIVQEQGWVSWIWEMGTYMFINCIWNANFYVLINNKQWSWPILFSVVFSSGAVFIFVAVYSTSSSGNIYDLNPYMFGSVVFWACFLMTWILCMAPRLTVRAFRAWFHPRDQDLIMEMQKYTLKEEYNQALATVKPPLVPPPPLYERKPLRVKVVEGWNNFVGWCRGVFKGEKVVDGIALGTVDSSTMVEVANGIPSPLMQTAPVLQISQVEIAKPDVVALQEDLPPSPTTPTSPYGLSPTSPTDPRRTSVIIPVIPSPPQAPPPLAITTSVATQEMIQVDSTYRYPPVPTPSSFVQDMSENTRTAHRGFSFSQSQGASLVILGNHSLKTAGRNFAAKTKAIGRIITGQRSKSQSSIAGESIGVPTEARKVSPLSDVSTGNVVVSPMEDEGEVTPQVVESMPELDMIAKRVDDPEDIFK